MEEQKESWPPAPAEIDRTPEYEAILDSEFARLKSYQASRSRLYLMFRFQIETKLPPKQCKEIVDGYCERRGIPFEKSTPAAQRFACGAAVIVLLFVLALLGLLILLLVVYTSVPHNVAERIAKERTQDLLIRMLIDLYVVFFAFLLIARSVMWVN